MHGFVCFVFCVLFGDVTGVQTSFLALGLNFSGPNRRTEIHELHCIEE